MSNQQENPLLTGIGIGPGDPGLMTLKGLKLIEEADVVFTPKARVKGDSLARSIMEGTGVRPAKVVEMEFPMTKNRQTLQEKWEAAARTVISEMADSSRGVFLTLGDPGIYSTWSYLQKALAETGASLRTETVPGISTMNAAGAALNRPLLLGREKLALIPLPEDLDDLDALVKLFDTVVIYKVSNRLDEFRRKIESLGLSDQTALVKRAGLEDEELYPSLKDLPVETEGYLSTALITTRMEKH